MYSPKQTSSYFAGLFSEMSSFNGPYGFWRSSVPTKHAIDVRGSRVDSGISTLCCTLLNLPLVINCTVNIHTWWFGWINLSVMYTIIYYICDVLNQKHFISSKKLWLKLKLASSYSTCNMSARLMSKAPSTGGTSIQIFWWRTCRPALSCKSKVRKPRSECLVPPRVKWGSGHTG